MTTDDKWLAAALRIVPEVGPEACQALLDKVIEKYRAGELARADLVKVLDLLRARMEALKSTRQRVSGSDVAQPWEKPGH